MYHPVNVYPVFDVVGSVPNCAPYVLLIVFGFASLPPLLSNVAVYVFAEVTKFAVTVVAAFIVPDSDDQLENLDVFPVTVFVDAVTFLPSDNVRILLLVEYVFPFGINKLFGDTLP